MKLPVSILFLGLLSLYGIVLESHRADAAWWPKTADSCITVATSTANLGLTTFTYLQWFYNTGANPLAGSGIATYENGSGAKGWNLGIAAGVLLGNIRFIHARVTTNLLYITNTTPVASTTQKGWTFIAVVSNSGGAAGDLARIYFGRTNKLATLQSLGTTTDGSGAFVTSTTTSTLQIQSRAQCQTSAGFPVAYSALVNRTMTLGEIRQWQFNPSVVRGTVAFHAFDYELNPAASLSVSKNRDQQKVAANASGTRPFRNAPVRMYR